MTDLIYMRDCVVIPALLAIQSYSKAAERLVMATGLAESGFKYKRQIAKHRKDGTIQYGPARGYFQMEPATHDDLWRRWIGPTRREHLLEGLRKISDHPGDVEELVANPVYAAAMCRIKYLSIPAPLPPEDDLPAIAAYWKKYYNTPLGAGTVEGFIKKTEAVMSL